MTKKIRRGSSTDAADAYVAGTQRVHEQLRELDRRADRFFGVGQKQPADWADVGTLNRIIELLNATLAIAK